MQLREISQSEETQVQKQKVTQKLPSCHFHHWPLYSPRSTTILTSDTTSLILSFPNITKLDTIQYAFLYALLSLLNIMLWDSSLLLPEPHGSFSTPYSVPLWDNGPPLGHPFHCWWTCLASSSTFSNATSNRHSHTLVVKVNLTTLGNGLASSIKVEHTTPCYPEIFLQVHTQEKCMPLFTKIKVQGGFLAAFFLFYFYFKHGNYYTCHVSLR